MKDSSRALRTAFAFVSLALAGGLGAQEIPAFPGALGHAANAFGGRGGKVVIVDTTDNRVDPNDGVVSLREAFSESGARYIVFAVGGVFDLGDEKLVLEGESGSDVTVACQSAPEPGVIMRGPGLNIQNGAQNVVMQHCRIRATDWGPRASTAGRAISVQGGGTRNILLDHMSLSWATDENFQVYLDADQTEGIDNVTLSNSLIAEGDADSSHPLSVAHPEWGYHSMGPSCNNNNDEHRPEGCSIVNNFIAHNASRNGMIWGGSGEIVNNIVYNWQNTGITARPQSGSDVDARIENNLLVAGPDTKDSQTNPNCGDASVRCAIYVGTPDESTPPASARIQVGRNWYVAPDSKRSDTQLIESSTGAVASSQATVIPVVTDSPIDVRRMAAPSSTHLHCVGASRPSRDAIDARIINEFKQRSGSVGIGSNQLGAQQNDSLQRDWSSYELNSRHPELYDVDRDGMADTWELKNGLDPNDPTDGSALLSDGDPYPALERFLQELASCHAPSWWNSLWRAWNRGSEKG